MDATRRSLALCLALLVTLACGESGQGGPTQPGPPQGAGALRMTLVATGLASPVLLTAPAGDERAFIVEQEGRIRLLLADGEVAATPFLDITDRVLVGGERGLLGLAFHPDYAVNGRFYVHYTAAGGASRIARFEVGPDPDRADPDSESVVLEVEQPFSNHNAGMLEFGPDGLLYIGLGDGGGAGDPGGNGQDTRTLLGSLLRIDVDAGDPYAIPEGNPFPPGGPDRPEIWAWGLRNPWRFSIDPVGGRLWVGDVGQSAYEEIDRQPLASGGINYGWNVMEGASCFSAATCDREGLTLPLLAYDHDQGCSVIGGYVYRGTAPELEGLYFYSDLCAGFVRSVRAEAASPAPVDWETPGLGRVLSFGRDGAGDLYVLTAAGAVWRVEGVAE